MSLGHRPPRPGETLLTIPELVLAGASRAPDSLAVAAPGRRPLRYGELGEFLTDFVARLNDLGLGRGDRVAIVLPNGPEMALAFLGVASGATAAPLNPAYREAEFAFYLADLGVGALVVPAGSDSPAVVAARSLGIAVLEAAADAGRPAGLLSLAGESRAPRADGGLAGPADVALVLHTSGSTSRPKAVPLAHSNLCASARNIARSLALTPADRCLNVMPLFHIHGLAAALLASLSAGAAVGCTGGFDAPRFFEAMDEVEPTWYTAVPTMHQAVLDRAEANRAVIERHPLRFVRSSSSALPPQIMERLEATFGAPVIEAYGMTEASHQVASNPLPPGVRKPGSVGLAAGPDVAIADDEWNFLPPGSSGEVVIRGRNVTSAYENNPEANASSFSSGWFRTGDRGRIDEDGYVYLEGRIKEIINRGGEKISPREVDEVLLDHPAVAQAVVFAVPDPRLGEEVAAVLVLREGASATEREIRTFAAARLADFKVPRRIVFASDIPKGPTGKLQRIGLAEKLGVAGADPRRPAGHVPPTSEAEVRLAAIWAEVLGVERPGIHDDFFDAGGDSVTGARLLARVRESTGVETSLIDFFATPSIAGLAARLAAPAGSDELERLLAEIEELSDEEALRRLEEGDGPS